MSEFFARTSGSGGWRVAIVDSADELNTEAANALLKLIEEPPAKALILLVSHRPGRLLRTLRSRCRRLTLAALDEQTVQDVLRRLPWRELPEREALPSRPACRAGSPGRALDLRDSLGAKAFDSFLKAKTPVCRGQTGGGRPFRATPGRGAGLRNLHRPACSIGWRGRPQPQPEADRAAALARAHQEISGNRGVVAGYNLDRRTAALNALATIEDALKAA